MANDPPPVSKERRKQILKVLFISLLLDLVQSNPLRQGHTGTWLTDLPDFLHLHPPSLPQTA